MQSQVPYFLMLFSAGLPVFFLEILLGQYAGVGPVKTFGHLVPLLRGLGYASVIRKIREWRLNHNIPTIGWTLTYSRPW